MNPVVSLFSGAGGLSLGFASAGAKPCFAADFDKHACASYKANLGIDCDNIDLSMEAIPDLLHDRLAGLGEVFAVIGGPPCQGFSTAGGRKGDDPRNNLIFNYIAIVERLRARWFLFENVEGLLTSSNGESIQLLVKLLIESGYTVRLEKVNFAAFGLPQSRKRVVLIGNKKSLHFRFPEETHSYNAGKHKADGLFSSSPPVGIALAGLGKAAERVCPVSYTSPVPANLYDARMRIGNAADTVTWHFSTASVDERRRATLLAPGQTMKNLSEEHWHPSYRRRAFRRVIDGTPTEKRGGAPFGIRRLDADLNSPTITGASTRELIHPSEDRPLTVRECARLQSFPDGCEFAGNALSAAQQVGNAFPPLAAEVFARHLARLDGKAGAEVGDACEHAPPGLIGFRLTDAAAKSPALAKTEVLLKALRHDTRHVVVSLPREVEEIA